MSWISVWGWYLAISAASYLVSVSLEMYFAKRKGLALYEPRNTRASVMILLGHYATSTLAGFVVLPAFLWAHQFSPWEIGPRFGDPWSEFLSWPFLLLVLLDDLVYYLHHRINHHVGFFWSIHQTHHSSNVYNMLVAARISWFDINTLVFWMPLVLAGFDPLLVVIVHSANLLWNPFIHSKLIGKLGPLEYILMTPSNHRIHHAANPRYLNKNYGGVLIVWDRLFGTYAAETEEVVFEQTPDLASESVLAIATRGLRPLSRHQKT